MFVCVCVCVVCVCVCVWSLISWILGNLWSFRELGRSPVCWNRGCAYCKILHEYWLYPTWDMFWVQLCIAVHNFKMKHLISFGSAWPCHSCECGLWHRPLFYERTGEATEGAVNLAVKFVTVVTGFFQVLPLDRWFPSYISAVVKGSKETAFLHIWGVRESEKRKKEKKKAE